MADYSELKRKAQEIKDEVKAGANTANRVGLALEETVKALEAENKRAEQAEVSLENAVQMLQDETEDLQSIRDDVERLGSDKADKSALEATNKEVSKKQNKLDNYKEDPSNGSVEIFAQDKVSVSNGSQGGVSCVEVYKEEDTEGIIPVARMSADKENGDYASVTVRGNEVHIDGDAVKVNGEDLESFRTTVVNDLTTGGADKALSAEMGKVLGEELTELEKEVGKADLAQLPIVDKAVAQALVMLVTRVEALESMVQALTGGYYHEELVAKELKIDGCSTIITGEGAPGAIPDFLGQIYVDTTNKESYTACGWDAVSDWKANN